MDSLMGDNVRKKERIFDEKFNSIMKTTGKNFIKYSDTVNEKSDFFFHDVFFF